MKQFLLILLLILSANAGFACSASFTDSAKPATDSLLQYKFVNTSYYGAGSGHTLNGTIYYGDASSDTIGPSVTKYHTYSIPGSYYVTLIIHVDSFSITTCSDTTTVLISIKYPVCGTASFSSSQTGDTVFLASTSSNPYSLNKTRLWDFGDGGTDTTANSMHVYSSSGPHTVKLKESWGDTTGKIYYSDSCNKSFLIPARSISGTIFKDTTVLPGLAYYKVYLINKDTMAHTVKIVDSSLDTGGYATKYKFYVATHSVYMVWAQMTNAGSLPYTFIPTYNPTSITWSNATPIYFDTGNSAGNNIIMQHGIQTNGPGFISGHVKYGPGTAAPGSPDSGMEMILKDSVDQLIASTYTDAAGFYHFDSIPNGLYTVYPEQFAKTIVGYGGININLFNPVHTGIDFVAESTVITPGPLGIKQINPEEQFKFYPNPANSELNVRWNGGVEGIANLSIINLTGQIEYSKRFYLDKNGIEKLNLNTLPSGYYLLSIETQAGPFYRKLIIQH